MRSDEPLGREPRFLDCPYSRTICVYGPIHDAAHLLTQAEVATLQRALPKRKNEYSTGRWLAHRALKELQRPTTNLLSGQHREPLWPQGTIGSIAHSERHAVVLVSSNPQLAGLGVDLELMGRLDEGLVGSILTERERLRRRNIDPTLIFSAKEAVYKLLFPILREYVDFHDVELLIDPEKHTFTVRYVGNSSACRCIEAAVGSYREIDGHWLTQVGLAKTGTSGDARSVQPSGAQIEINEERRRQRNTHASQRCHRE